MHYRLGTGGGIGNRTLACKRSIVPPYRGEEERCFTYFGCGRRTIQQYSPETESPMSLVPEQPDTPGTLNLLKALEKPRSLIACGDRTHDTLIAHRMPYQLG